MTYLTFCLTYAVIVLVAVPVARMLGPIFGGPLGLIVWLVDGPRDDD